jgi:hypothetical protein
MDREYLLVIRNEFNNARVGDLTLKYLHDYATKYVGKKIAKEDISGFLQCIQVLKDIPAEVDKK